MSRKHPFLFSLIALMTLLASGEVKAKAVPVGKPKAMPRLVVQIIVDQLRADHLDTYLPLYGQGGLRLLLDEGRLYRQASLPLLQADRASAIATISTGATPSQHGIVAWQWLNRETLRPMQAIDDRTVQGVNTIERYSPRWLNASTLGDELKLATNGRAEVVSIAAEADAAILAAGHAADQVVWIDNHSGTWATSSYYGKLPRWADQLNAHQPLDRRLNSTTWTPIYLPLAGTPWAEVLGEKHVFNHSFKGNARFAQFKQSGLVNDEVAQAASLAISQSPLGSDYTPDLLTLTLYAGTPQQKAVATTAHELQDTYTRLDKAVAQIISAAHAKVGIGNALFALTSTGYSIEEEEDERLARYRIPSGNFDMRRNVSLLGMYLVATYGQGNYVETSHGTDIYLNHRLIAERQLPLQEVQQRARDFLAQLSGVAQVHTAYDRQQGAWSPQQAKLQAGYYPQRSSDISIQLLPGWKCLTADGKTPSAQRESFLPFPLVLYGTDITPQIVDTPVSIDALAPTLSSAIRIRAPNACSVSPLP